MGGAEGKVAYIGKLKSLLGRPLLTYRQTQREHFVQRGSKRLQNDLVVSFSKVSRLLLLIIIVDPEQACENIAFARAQNSEVSQTSKLRSSRC